MKPQEYIDIAEKTFDLSIEDDSEEEDDQTTSEANAQKSATPLAIPELPLPKKRTFNILDSLSNGDESEPPIAKSTTLRVHSSNLTDFIRGDNKVNNAVRPTSTTVIQVEESKVSETSDFSDDINGRLRKIIKQLASVIGNQANLHCKQEQDIFKLLAFVERLTQSCQSEFDFLNDNYNYTNGLYESCLREKDVLKKEVEDLKEMNRFLQRCTQGGAIIGSGNSTTIAAAVAVETEAEQIMRLKKEIKEYKRFIKELMDRE